MCVRYRRHHFFLSDPSRKSCNGSGWDRQNGSVFVAWADGTPTKQRTHKNDPMDAAEPPPQPGNRNGVHNVVTVESKRDIKRARLEDHHDVSCS